jgi:uncharacterized integral membrane protein
MPWRVIILLVILVLVVLFSSFNLNRVDISVGFHTFKEIPLFLALMISFVLGALVMLPLAIRGFRKARRAQKVLKANEEPLEKEENSPVEAEEAGAEQKNRKK